MFSLRLSISLNTELGQRPGYIQHIAALAVIEAVKNTPGYKVSTCCNSVPGVLIYFYIIAIMRVHYVID